MSEDVIGVKAVLDLSGWTPNVKKVIDDTGDAEKSMGDMAKTFNDGLKVVENSIVAVAAAYATFDRAISQGEGIVAGKALFTSMAGGARQAAAGEEELRRTTRGLVDDQVAMAGASKLLSLGLVDNAQQAADLVGVGAQLGKVFMGDAGAGINAFNQIMANESPRGLAQFGISVDAVQKKMKDLEAQGISTREAFRMAVLDEARGKLDKLGDSVVMAGTALDRIKIQVGDFVDNFLEQAAQGFEDVAGGAQAYSAALNDVQERQAALERQGRIGYNPQGTSSPTGTGAPGGVPIPPTGAMVGTAQATVTMAQQLTTAVQQLNNNLNAWNAIKSVVGNITQSIRTNYAEYLQQRLQNNLNTWNAIKNVVGDIGQTLQTNYELTGQEMGLMRQIESIASGAAVNGPSGGRFQGQLLFNDQEATQAQSTLAAITSAYDRLQRMADEHPNLVSSDDLTRAKQLVESTQTWADNVQRGAQAFDSMNLAQLMGQTSGGPAGELESMVSNWLDQNAANNNNLQQIKDSMQLVTGQQTDVSLFVQNTLVPQIGAIAQTNAQGAGAIEVAIQNYLKQMELTGQQVTQAGLSAAEAQALYGSSGAVAGGGNAPGKTITVQQGMSATQAANFNGITVQQLILTTGALNANTIPVGTFTMQGGSVPTPVYDPTMGQITGAPGAPTTPAQQSPLVSGSQEILDASDRVQNSVVTTADVVNQRTASMGTDFTNLNTTGQTQLTGPGGLTAWWDQLQTMVTNVYNTIMPLINNMQQGMTQINSAAQNLNNVPSNYANNTTVNPNTGRGYAVGGSISGMRLVGERGPELYTPSRAGYIVNAANTESILSALAGVLNGGGGNHTHNNQRSATFNQYVTVQGNAQAASAMMGVTDALRGFG